MGQLAAKVRAKFPGAYDDLDDAVLEQQVLTKHPEYADLAQPDQAPEKERSWVDSAVDALPTIGGTIGGLVGKVPVVGTALAGLAGAGGEGYRQTIEAIRGNWENVPPTMGGRIQSMIQAGATQAGIEAGGRAAGALMTGAAKGLYRGALRPSAAIRSKTPNVVEQGLKDRILVGPKSSQGKALAGVRTSKAAADAAVGAASGAAPIAQSEIAKSLTPLMDDAGKAVRAGLPDEAPMIAARAGAIPQQVSVREAHELARTLNTRADRAFKMERMGGQPASIQDRINRELAGAYSGAVKDRVPGLADINQQTMTRMGLAKALGAAAERPSVLANLMAGGAGVGALYGTGDVGDAVGAYLTLRGLSSPRTLSGAGIALDALGRSSVNPTSQAVRAAMLAMMNGEEP